MLTALSGLGSALSYATSNLFSQRVTRKTRQFTQLAWVMLTGVLIIVPIAMLVDGLPQGGAQWRAAGLAALGGVLYFVAFSCFLTALRVGDLGLVSTLLALQGAFVTVAFVALGEPVTPVMAAGLVLCIVGGVLASFEGRARTTRGAGWALGAAVAMALVLLVYSRAGEIGWLSQAAFSRSATLAVVLPVALLTGGIAVPHGYRLQAVGAGALELGGLVLMMIALTLGPLMVAGVMTTQVGTVSVLVGVTVLRERPLRSQWLGIVLALGGATILGAVS